MKKYLLFVIILFTPIINLFGATIDNIKLSALELCASETLVVSFDTDNNFDQFNNFNLELSDVNGSFVNFQTIATIEGSNLNKFNALIPTIIAYSKKYRVRIVSTSPVITSSDNGKNITIHPYILNQIQISSNIASTNYKIGEGVSFITGLDSTKFDNLTLNWKFGDGASIQSYSGIRPPPVTYSSSGLKKIVLETISTDYCISSRTDNYYVIINDCGTKIDSSAIIIDSINHFKQPFDVTKLVAGSMIWIMPKASYRMSGQTGSKMTFILEPNSAMTSSRKFLNICFYLKPNSSLTISNRDFPQYNCFILSKNSKLIFDPVMTSSDSVTFFHYNSIIYCDSLNLDYSTAPIDGILILKKEGVLAVNDDNSGNNDKLEIYPNPVEDILHFKGTNPASEIVIYNALGIKIMETRINDELNIENLESGVYFIKMGDKYYKIMKIDK